jgi:hypothetical protein
VDYLTIAPEKPAQLFERPPLTPRDQVRTVNRDDLHRSRLSVLFRLFMAIPHVVWLLIWGAGMAMLSPVLWVAALVAGRPPEALRELYAMLVRYALHVHAFLFLAAEPFPGFLGRKPYPVDLDVPPPGPQNRWSIAFRLLLALPALALTGYLISFGAGGGSSSTSGDTPSTAGVSAGLVVTAAFLAWFFALWRARMPQGLRDLIVWALWYAAQAWAYVFLVTGRYPNSDPAIAPLSPLPAHPVRLRITDRLRRNRWTVAFRLVLTMPHIVWLGLWSVLMVPLAIVLWLLTLVLGRTPDPLHRFAAAYVRYASHVYAFANLGAGPFPGFVGAVGTYPVDVEFAAPEPQGRWTVLLRLLVALPALALSSAIGGAASIGAVGSWFYSLVTGRAPEGLRNVVAFSTRYGAQTYGYLLFVTGRYPYGGPSDFRR